MDKHLSPLLRQSLNIELLDKNPHNPNVMTAKAFNLLVDNVNRMGITDPILVRKVGERYRIVGGHHRAEAAKVLGYKEIDCTIIDTPSFTEDEEQFQLMRHNMIKGKLSPEKFVAMYEGLQEKYTREELAESFGFEEKSELDKLIDVTIKSLPEELQAKFQEGLKEVKSIKDLSNLLNKLFTQYGDTLPYGYMFLDFGGKESIWLRMHSIDYKNFKTFADICVHKNKTVDAAMRLLLQLIASNEVPSFNLQLDMLPDVKLPENLKTMPTEELLSMLPD